MAPKSLSRNSIRSGPTLPRRVVGLGEHPPDAATGGFSLDSPSTDVCGRLQGRGAGRRPASWEILEHHGDIIAQPFLFCKRGETGTLPNLPRVRGAGTEPPPGWARCGGGRLEPPSPGEEVFLSACRCPISVTGGRTREGLGVQCRHRKLGCWWVVGLNTGWVVGRHHSCGVLSSLMRTMRALLRYSPSTNGALGSKPPETKTREA